MHLIVIRYKLHTTPVGIFSSNQKRAKNFAFNNFFCLFSSKSIFFRRVYAIYIVLVRKTMNKMFALVTLHFTPMKKITSIDMLIYVSITYRHLVICLKLKRAGTNLSVVYPNPTHGTKLLFVTKLTSIFMFLIKFW